MTSQMKKSQQSKKMKQNNFLADFIEQEMYLQNPPMTTDKFINFCKRRGIQTTKKELEFFKKEKLFIPIKNKKGVKLYSSFQIYWLNILKKSFSITINLAGDDIKASSPFILLDSRQGNGSFSFDSIDDFVKKLKELTKKEPFREYFDLDIKKKELRKNYEKFNVILKFLLSVQSVYFPYAKSGGGTIQISGDDKKWHKMKRNFELNAILKKLDFNMGDIAKWYKIFSDEAQNILGIKQDDWIQLWKNIAWSKKDKLEGNTKLGVEYLQWAIMLKRIIEEDLQKEILDIDEMSNIAPDDILKFEPKKMDQYGVLLRATRNKRYSDQNKNFYHDQYKRSFYLANDFGLDYQPRVMVFVEGKTEKTIFPKIFEQFKGYKPKNLGIEFINFEGVDKLLSTAKNSEKLRKLLQKLQKQKKQQILSKSENKELNHIIKDLNNTNIVISNWTSFLSYNLEKWQIIPFFISDNEGGIKHFLKAEKPIKYHNKLYNIPNNWKYLWGITNTNKPLREKNFEMANFKDDEIAKVLTKILNKKIQSSDVKIQRKIEKGIKQINQNTEKSGNKIKIANKLIENLFDEYKKTKDKKLFKRPMFKVVDKIINLAILNYPPVDKIAELKNKKYVENMLKKKLSPGSTKPNNFAK